MILIVRAGSIGSLEGASHLLAHLANRISSFGHDQLERLEDMPHFIPHLDVDVTTAFPDLLGKPGSIAEQNLVIADLNEKSVMALAERMGDKAEAVRLRHATCPLPPELHVELIDFHHLMPRFDLTLIKTELRN